MLNYIVEFIGTFIFLSVILRVGEPIPIAVALLASIYFGGSISGGHFNPAVSIMMYLKKSLSGKDLPMYILSQVVGGMTALYFYRMNKNA
ncbi:MAG: hypothetical protein CL470_08305 [Acidimicrobiaceae bacterium]|nr:hypothetical protein [Acidimicrobiaceae bacterium]|tara:strand:- start:836 stop:1105 length:270 start_codon:yes stop_codon:yes gene_type:complete